MVVTAVIVGILACGALPLAELAVQRGHEIELRRALREIRGALDAYRAAADEGRIAKAPGASGYPPSLEALERGVVDARSAGKAKIYFLRRLPRDPFAGEALPATETWGKRSYVSAPEAPAEGVDVFDVYSRSDAVGLNGVPYRRW
jgi:general secretion pathway protein G